MKLNITPIVFFSTLFLISYSLNAQESDLETHVTILEVMERVITPATNTLWAADPQNEEDWIVLEEAAITTITAATLTGIGGIGPQDAEWVSNPLYQAFNQAMTLAAISLLEAVRKKDLDALFEAGDALYTPCEACHLMFNPAVQALP